MRRLRPTIFRFLHPFHSVLYNILYFESVLVFAIQRHYIFKLEILQQILKKKKKKKKN